MPTWDQCLCPVASVASVNGGKKGLPSLELSPFLFVLSVASACSVDKLTLWSPWPIQWNHIYAWKFNQETFANVHEKFNFQMSSKHLYIF